jgi:hypothetical protein
MRNRLFASWDLRCCPGEWDWRISHSGSHRVRIRRQRARRRRQGANRTEPSLRVRHHREATPRRSDRQIRMAQQQTAAETAPRQRGPGATANGARLGATGTRGWK